MRSELGDTYTESLRELYHQRLPGAVDLCCYWFEKARGAIEDGRLKRAGLLATQGIRGGANRKTLERIKETGDVFWAQSDRNWILEGAAVHVSMVGFDGGSEATCKLDNRAVHAINSDLTSAVDLTEATVLLENTGIAFIGPSPHGRFDIPPELAEGMLRAPGNPNGKPNSVVVRPVVSAVDITRRTRDLYTIDFGTMDIQEASLFVVPFEYVRETVLPVRKDNRRRAYAENWWQYGEPRPGMREALRLMSRFACTPRVAKHRVFVWCSAATLANDGTVVFAREDDYFFGVLHSKVHELWARRQGTQLREAESGFRYTPTTCFETFPFPWLPGEEPIDDPRVQAIAAPAKKLVDKRDRWLNPEGATEAELKKRTLSTLYSERPTRLDIAHMKLDEAVLDAYGWPHDITDDQILERLLAMNFERSEGRA